jgi:predicted MPP superfamily phosphohydrolase
MKSFIAIALSIACLALVYLCAKIARLPVLARRPRPLAWAIAIIFAAALLMVHGLRGFFIYLAMIFAAGDIIAPAFPRKAWDRFWRGGLAAFVLAAGFCVYGYFHAKDIVIKNYEITIDKNTGGGAGRLKAVLITDMHIGEIIKEPELDAIAERINDIAPDIVFLGGDIYDESTLSHEIEHSLGTWRKIKSKYGIYYVGGNHEQHAMARRGRSLPPDLSKAGVRVLDDSTAQAGGFNRVGRRDFSAKGRAPIAALTAGLDKNMPVIVLDHQPVEFAAEEDAGADLLLSGHTHAGQVFPVGLISGFISTNELGYGHGKYGKLQVVVSSGAGVWGFPMRVGTNSEIVVLDIKAGK